MQLDNVLKVTTAVDDIDRNEPTNTPSDSLAPLNCINGKSEMVMDIFTRCLASLFQKRNVEI